MNLQKTKVAPRVAFRVLAVLVIVAAGVGGMLFLSSMRKPPAQATYTEPALRVITKEVRWEDVPVVITGYGQARALDTVSITPEVAGNVVEIHPRLELGEVIPAGELLFRIDPRDYEAGRDQAQAQAEQANNAVERLKRQFGIDKKRLGTVRRSRDLAQAEFGRVKQLFDEDEVGTRSGVDNAEVMFNQANDAFDLLAQAVELYPIRIREAEAVLAGAEAALVLAETRLARTEVRVDFDGRIKQVQVERGQYVAPGAPVLTLANDAVIEISVPLDSRDARSWIRFADGQTLTDGAWFTAVEPVECRISWTEDADGHYWRGTLNRVEKFDQTNRTVIVAVRVERGGALAEGHGLPLVDGMFCRVDIPGKTLEKVYRLPQWAVSPDGQVFIASDNRLERRDVTVLRKQGDETFLSAGLEPGEEVITTRLVNPLPNSLLEIQDPEAAGAETPVEAPIRVGDTGLEETT